MCCVSLWFFVVVFLLLVIIVVVCVIIPAYTAIIIADVLYLSFFILFCFPSCIFDVFLPFIYFFTMFLSVLSASSFVFFFYLFLFLLLYTLSVELFLLWCILRCYYFFFLFLFLLFATYFFSSFTFVMLLYRHCINFLVRSFPPGCASQSESILV